MTDQKPGVDHAQVQAELNIALLCGSNNVIEDCTETEETLFVTCISGDSHKLQELLNDKLFLATAIERKSQRFGAIRRENQQPPSYAEHGNSSRTRQDDKISTRSCREAQGSLPRPC